MSVTFNKTIAVYNPEIILKEAYQRKCLLDVEIMLNRTSSRINSLVLSCAIPWLKEAMKERKEDDSLKIILALEGISSDALDKLINLMHTGIVYESNNDIKTQVTKLCYCLGMSIKEEEPFNEDFEVINKTTNLKHTTKIEDEKDDCMETEDIEDSDESSVKLTTTAKKKKLKRIFSANLSVDDLTCNVCQRSFSAMYKLRIHSLIHSATPPFVCSFCGRGFNNKYKMRGHEKRHCGNLTMKDNPILLQKVSWPETEGLGR